MKNIKKILISAGEASGDFYAANLSRELIKKTKGKIKIIGFGGEMMKAAGVDVKIELLKYAIIGFIEVFIKIFLIISVYLKAVSILKKEKPDLLVVIDYPGFHFNLIKKAKKIGIKKVVYYITPQIWAWNYKRIYEMKKYVDMVIVVLPFEKKIYEKENIKVKYFGHPLSEYLLKNKRKLLKKNNKKIIGIFPGSRNSEIKKIFPVILKSAFLIAKKNDDIQFIIFRSHTVDMKTLLKYVKNYFGLDIIITDGKEKLNYKIDCAIAKSGTITLELSLLKIPHLIVYRTSALNYYLAKKLAKVKFIGLPNLISEKLIVKEFIQDELTPENISDEVNKILHNKKYRTNIINSFEILKKQLYKKNITAKIADSIIKEIKQ